MRVIPLYNMLVGTNNKFNLICSQFVAGHSYLYAWHKGGDAHKTSKTFLRVEDLVVFEIKLYLIIS
jgi:hypothetical protein